MTDEKKIEHGEQNTSDSWIDDIEKFSRQIWLAGLGSFSKITSDGSKLFDDLVNDGEKAEKEAKNEVSKQVDAVKSSADSAKTKVEEAKDKVKGKWNALEEAFDQRLNSAISRLGVPSYIDVKALETKIDNLTVQVEQMTGVSLTSVKPAARKAPAKVKTAAKPDAKPAADSAPAAVAEPAPSEGAAS